LKKVLFISSMGGHLSELMKLEPLFKNYDYSIITEKDRTTKSLSYKYKGKIFFMPYCTRNNFLKYMFKYPCVILKSVYLLIKIKPDVIISTGTHTAVPMCYFGKLFRKKIIYIETYANITKKTLSGRFVYPISDLFIVQWSQMKKLYPNAVLIKNFEK